MKNGFLFSFFELLIEYVARFFILFLAMVYSNQLFGVYSTYSLVIFVILLFWMVLPAIKIGSIIADKSKKTNKRAEK